MSEIVGQRDERLASFARDCRAIVQACRRPEEALLPVLRLAQARWGCVGDELVLGIAQLLDLPAARVSSVLSVYPSLRRLPAGEHVIAVCRSLPCRLMGAVEVLDHLRERLSIGPGETTDDGRFSVVEVECLGACHTAPAMLLDGELHDSLTRERLDQLLGRLS